MQIEITDIATLDGITINAPNRTDIVSSTPAPRIPLPPASGTFALQSVGGVVQWVATTLAGNTSTPASVSPSYEFDKLINCTYKDNVLAYTSGDLQAFIGDSIAGYVAASALKDGPAFNMMMPDLSEDMVFQLAIFNSQNQAQAGAVVIYKVNGQLFINGDSIISAGDMLAITVQGRGFVATSKGGQIVDSGQVAGTDALRLGLMMCSQQSTATLPSITVTSA